MKEATLISLLYIICFSVLAQEKKDSVAFDKQSKFGMGLTLSFDLAKKDKYFPYNQYTGYIYNDPSYKEKVFRNALHNSFLLPSIECVYINKYFTHSFSLGYIRQSINSAITDYDPEGFFTELNLSYGFARILFYNKLKSIYPNIQIQESYSSKLITTSTFNETGKLLNQIKDKSNVYYTKIIIGESVYKRDCIYSLDLTFGLVALIDGVHDFKQIQSSILQTEEIKYYNFFLMDQLLSENHFFQNIQFNFIYKF
jgi:hypothetical protein